MKNYFKPVVLIGEGGEISVDPPGNVGSLYNNGDGEGEGGGSKSMAQSVTADLTQTNEADWG